MNRSRYGLVFIYVTIIFLLFLAVAPLSSWSASMSSSRPAQSEKVTITSPQSSSDTYSISGQVTDSAGNPVSNVSVNACALNKQPVLLVHGWSGPDSDRLTDDEVGFAKLYQWMTNDGYVEDCNLFFATGVSPSNSREQNRQAIQQNLRDAYDLLVDINPQWRGHFDIIGHSYGGLNARFYLESSVSSQ